MSTRTRQRRPARWPLALLAVAVLGVVFLLGVGLGLSLEERPQTGKTQTSVRTFQPPGVATETATVTVP